MRVIRGSTVDLTLFDIETGKEVDMRAVSPSTAVATLQMATVGCDKTTIPSLSGINVSLSYYKIIRKHE